MEHRRVAVFAFFLVVCFSAGYAGPLKKGMVNGNDARIEDFPFAVVVWPYEHMCGGVIIDERHILTAAHCTMFDERQYHVRTGFWGAVILAGTENSIKHTPDQVYEIADFIWHPKYNYTPMYHNDIGIIKLNRSIVFNERMQKVKLPTKEAPESGDAVAIGWGFDPNYASYPHDTALKQVPMHIESRAACSRDYQPQLQSQMCARPDVGRGPCPRDSGNPLLLDGEVIGIISVGTTCEEGRTLVYTHVYSYLDWIHEVINS